MTLIEGVGDEVIQFLGVVLVTMVGLFAWWSTNARPGRYRTVVVMRTRPHHPVTVSFRSRPNFMITNNQPSSSTSTNQESTTDTVAVSPSEAVEENRDASRVIPLQEMDSIIDADMAMMNNNRLHFYRRLDAPGSVQGIADSTSDESETQDEAEPASTDQIREMDSIVSAMEADVTAGCDFFTRPSEANANVTSTKSEKKNENSAPSSTSGVSKMESRDAATHVEENLITDDAGTTSSKDGGDGKDEGQRKILIKLKYLNDTLKEVEGSLDELLKDFKWRHFSVELSSEARVRLIFNGRVLLDDAATLRALGLHHRAVVHALVHPPRPQQALGAAEAPAPELVSEAAAAERAWDFENILMTFMSVVLTIIWFFRCEYSNMFTTSASVALFGVTVFYSLAIFGLYLTDPSHFERRAPQPVPNN